MTKIATMTPTPSSLPALDGKFARLALAALLGGAAATGFTPIFVRLGELDPSATGFWRLGLALPVLWLLSSFEGRPTRLPRQTTNRSYYSWLVAAGLFFAGDVAIFNWSLNFTAVANASLLANSAPIFVALGAWLFLGERFKRIFLVGLAVALLGATILIGASFKVGLEYLFGDFLALLTAIFYAGYILSIQQLRRHVTATTTMIGSGLITGAALLALTFLSGERLIALTLQGWLALVGLALVSHVSGQGMITYALAHLPASFSSVSLLMQPVVATILAWFILQEPLGLWQAGGGLIILAGIFLARRGSP